MPRHRMPLSVKEHAFVRHFLAGQSGVRGNASRAYIAAGYGPKAAYSGASELLRKPRIQDAIAAYLRKADLTVDRVLEELRRLAFVDMRDVATWGPGGVVLKASAELPDDVAPAVADVIEHRTTRTTTRATRAIGKPGEPGYVPDGAIATTTVERNLRVKLHSKVEALTALSKYLGILSTDPDGPAQRPLLPKGFFAAVILGDVEKIKGFAQEVPGLLEATAELLPDAPPPCPGGHGRGAGGGPCPGRAKGGPGGPRDDGRPGENPGRKIQVMTRHDIIPIARSPLAPDVAASVSKEPAGPRLSEGVGVSVQSRGRVADPLP